MELKTLTFKGNGSIITKEVETFTWEKLDYVEIVKNAFEL